MRLESSTEPSTAGVLQELSRDQDVRVRIFATVARIARGDLPTVDSLLADPDPRVLRAALRAGMAIDSVDVARRAGALMRSDDPSTILCGIELFALAPDERLRPRAIDLFARLVLREDRTMIGSLTPRLELLAGAAPGVRPAQWQKWWQGLDRRRWPLQKPTIAREQAIASAPSAAYASFARQLSALTEHPIDLMICLDATRSMWSDLPAAQATADATARATLDLVPGSRVGLVAYRDRRSDFVTRVTPMTDDLGAWRPALWELVAEKGGSAPESVEDGLRAAYNGHAWDRSRHNFVILIGDGPPHPGSRGSCASMAKEARERFGVKTIVVSARDAKAEREIQGFTEIAEEGGGDVIRLANAADLPSLMLGGSFGDDWAPLVRAFRQRCDWLLH